MQEREIPANKQKDAAWPNDWSVWSDILINKITGNIHATPSNSRLQLPQTQTKSCDMPALLWKQLGIIYNVH